MNRTFKSSKIIKAVVGKRVGICVREAGNLAILDLEGPLWVIFLQLYHFGEKSETL